MMHSDEQLMMIRAAIKQFPKTFGLRAYPGEEFAISEYDSYYSEMEHCVLLYLHRYRPSDGTWHAFCKGTFNELRKEIVELK